MPPTLTFMHRWSRLTKNELRLNDALAIRYSTRSGSTEFTKQYLIDLVKENVPAVETTVSFKAEEVVASSTKQKSDTTDRH
jgi:hypothetical protein